VLEFSASSSNSCAHLEASGAQLIQSIVQTFEDGLAVLAWGGLQCILRGHSKGEESDNIEVVCHCCVPQRPDELQQEHCAIKAAHNSTQPRWTDQMFSFQRSGQPYTPCMTVDM